MGRLIVALNESHLAYDTLTATPEPDVPSKKGADATHNTAHTFINEEVKNSLLLDYHSKH